MIHVTEKRMCDLINGKIMNKKIFYGIAVFIVAAMAAWNVNFSSQAEGMSDIMVANTEALADNEGGGESGKLDCYMTVHYDPKASGSFKVKACGKKCAETDATYKADPIADIKCQ